MPRCGSQCTICDLPIRFDTYAGCGHGCKYCFVKRNADIDDVKGTGGETYRQLLSFINGKRGGEVAWCDWNIPVHIGGVSDPFQPVERKYKKTLDVLKVLEKTQYPAVISTKGHLCVEEPYLSILSRCNVVMQISMACDKYDRLEPGAPTYKERLEMLRILSGKVKRTIVRVQPYLHECMKDIKAEIKNYAEAGAYGAIFEGMKFINAKPGLVKVAGDICYPLSILEPDFQVFKQTCHNNRIKFYSGENRLRAMGDSLTCCGIDGLEGFVPNTFNANHLLRGERTEPTPGQKRADTSLCFKSLHQNTLDTQWLKGKSFEHVMIKELNQNQTIYDAFNLRKKP